MKSTQFDQLTQVLSARATRRAGLVMLAGLLLTPLIGPGSTVGNVTAARGRRGRGNKDRRHRNRQNAARDRRRQQTTRAASIPASCCRNARCAPKKGAYLVQCCYENQNLDGANFQSANATKANFSKASLKNANFISSNLSGACFVDADITGARFTGANQQGVVRCRTRTSAGIDNSGCGKGSRCCRTCVELGGTGCHLGGSCCGGAPCLGGGDGTCGCPAGAIFCPDGECRECCGDGDCPGTDACCDGACTANAWANETTFPVIPGAENDYSFTYGVAVSADEQTAWVADENHHLISVWNKSGGTWVHKTTFGTEGSGANEFKRPYDVAVADDGKTVWVADYGNDRISVWTESGGVWGNQTTFGSSGSGANHLSGPLGLAVSADGQTVWVADTLNQRISVWTKSGGAWSNQTTFGSGPGAGASQFNGPQALAVAADGQTIWVTDTSNHRISIWTKSGTGWSNQTTFGGGPGAGASQFNLPTGVAVAVGEQTVWVADQVNHRVSIWTKTGGAWSNKAILGAGQGPGTSQFNNPEGVAVAKDGQTLWVAEEWNHRVSVWSKGCPGP